MSQMEQNKEILLDVQNLTKHFPIKQSIAEILRRDEKKFVNAVDHVSLQVFRGENLGLVGESGCGKSTLGYTMIRYYEPTEGKVYFDGKDITAMPHSEWRQYCRRFQMIFQDPYSSLNPRMTIREMIMEAVKYHGIVPETELESYSLDILEKVGLSREMADRMPSEFSGGQRQRAGIARALAVKPELVIADEPVSALDVSVQAQVINLLDDLQKDLNLTILFISHDLRVVRHVTQRIAVMYLGAIVEIAPTEELFANPQHPYTRILLKASPNLDPRNRNEKPMIEGELPTPIDVPSGCRFHTRCPYATERCSVEVPEFREVSDGHRAACHLLNK